MFLSPVVAQAQTMSLAEQQAEAQRLTALCSPQHPVANGSMRANYEAAAALTQCFYDNVDARYPENLKAGWLERIKQYKALAQQYQ
jgi:hypothetical protein